MGSAEVQRLSLAKAARALGVLATIRASSEDSHNIGRLVSAECCCNRALPPAARAPACCGIFFP